MHDYSINILSHACPGKKDQDSKCRFGPLKNITAIHGSTTLSLEFHGGCAASSWLVLLVELISSAYKLYCLQLVSLCMYLCSHCHCHYAQPHVTYYCIDWEKCCCRWKCCLIRLCFDKTNVCNHIYVHAWTCMYVMCALYFGWPASYIIMYVSVFQVICNCLARNFARFKSTHYQCSSVITSMSIIQFLSTRCSGLLQGEDKLPIIFIA